MRSYKTLGSVVLTVGSLALMAGCAPSNGENDTIINTIDVNKNLGSFKVTANVPSQKSGTIPNNLGDQVSGGTLSIDQTAISAVVDAPKTGKPSTALLTARTVSVIVHLASSSGLSTVCNDNSNKYGPFVATLDENNQPTDISPKTVDVSQSTIDLLNAGPASVCVEVTANFDGTVSLDNFTFTLTKAQAAAAANAASSGNFQ